MQGIDAKLGRRPKNGQLGAMIGPCTRRVWASLAGNMVTLSLVSLLPWASWALHHCACANEMVTSHIDTNMPHPELPMTHGTPAVVSALGDRFWYLVHTISAVDCSSQLTQSVGDLSSNRPTATTTSPNPGTLPTSAEGLQAQCD